MPYAHKSNGRLCILRLWLILVATAYLFVYIKGTWHAGEIVQFDASRLGGTLVPQWECTKISRMCGCVSALSKHDGNATSLSSHVMTDLARSIVPCKNSSVLPNVRVLLDKTSWLGQEFPAGDFECPNSICRLSRGIEDDDAASKTSTQLPLSVDVFVTAVPGGMARPRSRLGQRSVALALESPARYLFTRNEMWLREHGFTDVVRPGIWNAHAPAEILGEVKSWRMSYSNADWEHYQRPPLPVSKKIKGIASFITNCDENTQTRRLKLLDALQAGGVPVYSFGKCRQTHAISKLFPECVANQTDTINGNRSPQFDFVKMCVLRRFMFAAAFENDVAKDYVTEKLYQPLLAGSLPVYAGAPNVGSYLPAPEAAVIASDLSDRGIDEMVAEVKALLSDHARYDAGFEWKQRQPASHMNVVVRHSYAALPCLVCDAIFAGSEA